ncbi:cadherin domain containing protein [Rhizobium phage AF3]|uniref:Cadherin domain containing protein n=1 Tax=Rhizobium phage AF3 TaxID=2763529 RepID=A0A7G7WVZ0_9CAUD|nr:cadherin domain containing protein [Rhizobium phage AF3]QNH71384.1 cadherin domain containing protein [Rhizobium phage AF3]
MTKRQTLIERYEANRGFKMTLKEMSIILGIPLNFLRLGKKIIESDPIVYDPHILLSNSSITETAEDGTIIGNLFVTGGFGSYNFSIVSDPDSKFILSGSSLMKNGLMDFETKTTHVVTIRANNGAGSIVDQAFTITVLNSLEGILGPTNATFVEFKAAGTLVAAVTGLDTGASETLVSMEPDDGSLEISGNSIVKGNFASLPGVYDLVIQTSTGRQLVMRITIIQQDMTLSNVVIPENLPVGFEVGTLNIQNGNGTYAYTVVSDPDDKFVTDENKLLLSSPVDFETKTSHNVTIQASNGIDNPISVDFSIAVTNVLEGTLAPTMATFDVSDVPGTGIATITGLDAGAQEVIVDITPDDGRLVLTNGNIVIKGDTASIPGVINATLTTSAGRTLDIAIVVTQETVEEGSVLLLSDGSTFGLSGDQVEFDLGIHYGDDLTLRDIPIATTPSPNALILIKTASGSRKISLSELLGTLEN